MNETEMGRTLAAAAFSRIRADILSSKLLPGARLRFEPLKKAYGVGRARCAKRCRGWWSAGWSPPRGNAASAWRRPRSRTFRTSPTFAPMSNAWRSGNRSSTATISGRPTWSRPITGSICWSSATRPNRWTKSCGKRGIANFILRFCRRAARAGCCTWWRCSPTSSTATAASRSRAACRQTGFARHQRIVDAALKRDGDLADRLMKDHIAHTTRLIIENWHAVAKPRQRGDATHAALNRTAKRASKRAARSPARA